MTRPRRPIIALLGVDGSGKSTQARLLATWLSGQGWPASYFENAGGRPVWDRLGRLAGRGDGRGLFGGGYVAIEASVRWLAIARALLLSRLTGRIAVMDRYAYCQYALLRARGDSGERLIRTLFALFPQPDVVCLLTVAPAVAQQRVELRGRDQEEVDYLAAFDAAYRSLPEFPAFQIIDAGGEPEAVQRAIRAAVGDQVRPAGWRRRGSAAPSATHRTGRASGRYR